jgi:hypothetical protein
MIRPIIDDYTILVAEDRFDEKGERPIFSSPAPAAPSFVVPTSTTGPTGILLSGTANGTGLRCSSCPRAATFGPLRLTLLSANVYHVTRQV